MTPESFCEIFVLVILLGRGGARRSVRWSRRGTRGQPPLVTRGRARVCIRVGSDRAGRLAASLPAGPVRSVRLDILGTPRLSWRYLW